jgi:hypothetical protein
VELFFCELQPVGTQLDVSAYISKVVSFISNKVMQYSKDQMNSSVRSDSIFFCSSTLFVRWLITYVITGRNFIVVDSSY